MALPGQARPGGQSHNRLCCDSRRALTGPGALTTLNQEKAEHLSCWSQDKVTETTLAGDLEHVSQAGPQATAHSSSAGPEVPLSCLLWVSPGPTSQLCGRGGAGDEWTKGIQATCPWKDSESRAHSALRGIPLAKGEGNCTFTSVEPALTDPRRSRKREGDPQA